MRRMKGQEQLATAFMITSLLVFLILFPKLQEAAEAAVVRSSAFQANEISSIINLLQSAPESSHMQFKLSRIKCEIEINPVYVSYSLGNGKFKFYILQTSVKIPTSSFKCSEETEKTLCLIRRKDSIDVVETGFDCLKFV